MILKKIIRIAILALLAGRAKGQSTVVFGRIRDSVLQRNCANVYVSLFKDYSVLFDRTVTNASGYFKFKSAIPTHFYILKVFHPDFEAYRITIYVPDSNSVDLGSIYLQPKSDTL